METHIHGVNVCIGPLVVDVVAIRERPEDMDVPPESGDGEEWEYMSVLLEPLHPDHLPQVRSTPVPVMTDGSIF